MPIDVQKYTVSKLFGGSWGGHLQRQRTFELTRDWMRNDAKRIRNVPETYQEWHFAVALFEAEKRLWWVWVARTGPRMLDGLLWSAQENYFWSTQIIYIYIYYLFICLNIWTDKSIFKHFDIYICIQTHIYVYICVNNMYMYIYIRTYVYHKRQRIT